MLDVEYSGPAKRDSLERFAHLFANASVIAGFNLKYDLHWLRRFGIRPAPHQRVWCCQLFEYLVSAQTVRLDSLEAAIERRGLGHKSKGINEYWDKGVDTLRIPYEVLTERALSDARLTERLARTQIRMLRDHSEQFSKLVSLNNQDLLVLQEMEWNGLKLDFDAMNRKEQEANARIAEIDRELGLLSGGVPINYQSNFDRSALLYGGTITEPFQEAVGTFKTGERAGQPKYVWRERQHVLERLVAPLTGSELDKPGYWSTDADTLSQLDATKKGKTIISLLAERQELAKLSNTYFKGFRERAALMGWHDGVIHGQFNQTIPVTGRLSSSRPNLQNLPPATDAVLVTRF